MTPETVVTIGRQALELTLIVSAPLLLVALLVGLVVSFFQAITQLNEQTLSFLPKLVAVAATLVVVGPWMITTLVDYLQRTLIGIPQMVSGG
ncbi:MAG: flagellar biosynthesis protein FliQ [Burkholderiaceae bacterium]|nr:flagellar biosynthesis protein FliQ [Burkholderiales bacterium]MCZ8108461.1 flagellar biosynthesis protein FliQ [Burkholderiales bacterium]MCZ8340807.1 flagellar biosynthesis protein FliQ [Burkholderiaceae bacterium]